MPPIDETKEAKPVKDILENLRRNKEAFNSIEHVGLMDDLMKLICNHSQWEKSIARPRIENVSASLFCRCMLTNFSTGRLKALKWHLEICERTELDTGAPVWKQ